MTGNYKEHSLRAGMSPSSTSPLDWPPLLGFDWPTHPSDTGPDFVAPV